jgi:threonine dehydrogenase-like Zn-dependent dehydrogenase
LERLVSHQMTLAEGQKAFELLHAAKASKIVLSP